MDGISNNALFVDFSKIYGKDAEQVLKDLVEFRNELTGADDFSFETFQNVTKEIIGLKESKAKLEEKIKQAENARKEGEQKAGKEAAINIRKARDEANSKIKKIQDEANKKIQEAKAEADAARTNAGAAAAKKIRKARDKAEREVISVKAEATAAKTKAEKDAEIKIKEARANAAKDIESAEAYAEEAVSVARRATQEKQKYKELVLNLNDIIAKLKAKLIDSIGADDNFIVKLEKDLDDLARKVKTENAISLDVIESVVARYGNKGSEESKTVLATLWNLWTSVKENGMNVQETVLANKLQIFVIILVGVLLYYGFLSDSTQLDDAGTLNTEGNEVFELVKNKSRGDPGFADDLKTCGRNFAAEALEALKGAGSTAAAGSAVASALESVSTTIGFGGDAKRASDFVNTELDSLDKDQSRELVSYDAVNGVKNVAEGVAYVTRVGVRELRSLQNAIQAGIPTFVIQVSKYLSRSVAAGVLVASTFCPQTLAVGVGVKATSSILLTAALTFDIESVYDQGANAIKYFLEEFVETVWENGIKYLLKKNTQIKGRLLTDVKKDNTDDDIVTNSELTDDPKNYFSENFEEIQEFDDYVNSTATNFVSRRCQLISEMVAEGAESSLENCLAIMSNSVYSVESNKYYLSLLESWNQQIMNEDVSKEDAVQLQKTLENIGPLAFEGISNMDLTGRLREKLQELVSNIQSIYTSDGKLITLSTRARANDQMKVLEKILEEKGGTASDFLKLGIIMDTASDITIAQVSQKFDFLEIFTSKLRDDFENSDTKTIGEVVDAAFKNISENGDVGKFQRLFNARFKDTQDMFSRLLSDINKDTYQKIKILMNNNKITSFRNVINEVLKATKLLDFINNDSFADGFAVVEKIWKERHSGDGKSILYRVHVLNQVFITEGLEIPEILSQSLNAFIKSTLEPGMLSFTSGEATGSTGTIPVGMRSLPQVTMSIDTKTPLKSNHLRSSRSTISSRVASKIKY